MAQAKPKDDPAANAPAKPKKPLALMIVLLLLGLTLGGGGAAGYFLFLAPKGEHDAEAEAAKEKAALEAIPPEFIEIKRMTVPMLDSTGRLTGYMGVDLNFQVAGGPDVEFAKARLPMIRHAINEALSQTAVTVEGKPRVLDYARAEKLLTDSANRALGRDVVISTQIVSALPL